MDVTPDRTAWGGRTNSLTNETGDRTGADMVREEGEGYLNATKGDRPGTPEGELGTHTYQGGRKDGDEGHIWELPGNYPFFTVVMVIYHYVERIWRILVTPIFCISYTTTK